MHFERLLTRITFSYGWDPANYGEIDNPLRAAGKNNWGNFELNPLTTDATISYNNILTLYNDGIKVICPNSWESDEATKVREPRYSLTVH